MGVYVGLRIGKKEIEAVALRLDDAGGEVLERFFARTVDADSLVAALKECDKELGRHSRLWAVGLPSEEFSLRIMEFPFKNLRAVQSALPFEMESLLPFGAEDIETSAIILSTSQDGSSRALGSAIRKERLTFYTDALEQAGIRPQIVMPGVAALYQFYSKILAPSLSHTHSGTVVIADAFAESIEFCLIENGNLADLHSSGTDEAETVRFVAACEKKPEKIYMAGKNADIHLSGLQRRGNLIPQDLSGGLWKEELASFVKSEKPEEIALPLGLAAACMGGAKDMFNFSRKKFFAGGLRLANRFAVAGIVCCILLWIGFLGYRNHLKAGQLQEIRSEIDHVFKIVLPNARLVKPHFRLKRELGELERKLRGVGIVDSKRADLLWMLKRIAEKLPPGIKIEIDELLYDEKGITLSGRTDRFESVSAIRERLSTIEPFKKVEVKESKASADNSRWIFRIRMSV